MKHLLFALSAAFTVGSASAADNLIVGGGFEAPEAPTAGYTLNATPLGWTGQGDIVGQGYAGAVNSGDGKQWFDLNAGTGASTGISQTMNLSAGTTYLFSFLYNGGQPQYRWTTAINFSIATATSTLLAGSVSTAAMNVYFGGTPWASYAGELFVADNTTATVRFQPNGIWANGFIDAVSLTVSAVPETSTQALMLLGLAAVACTGLRRRQ